MTSESHGPFTSPDPQLEYPFNTQGLLEIEINGSWSVVDSNVFRSWTGPRRLNGKPYYGPRFYWLTNDGSYDGATAD